MTTNNHDLYFDTTANTMYYTNPQGTISTITLDSSSTVDTSMWTNSNLSTYTVDNNALNEYWAQINDFKFKEFIDVMPDLTKIEEMCKMYPAMEKAFENFKAVYNLTKDDYEARKNNDS